MEIEAEIVHAMVLDSMPEPDETIADAFEIERMAPYIAMIELYKREPKDCPIARGNWVIDFTLKSGTKNCLKLPRKMTEEHVYAFMKPLIDLVNKNKH